MFDVNHLYHKVIVPTLTRMGPEYYKEHSCLQMLGTIGVESAMGTWLTQLKGGPANGIAQIENPTAEDILFRYGDLQPERRFHIMYASFPEGYVYDKRDFNGDKLRYLLCTNMAFSVAVARMKYWMVPAPQPTTVLGYANYWKKYYNAAGARGEAASEYVRLWNEWIADTLRRKM